MIKNERTVNGIRIKEIYGANQSKTFIGNLITDLDFHEAVKKVKDNPDRYKDQKDKQ